MMPKRSDPPGPLAEPIRDYLDLQESLGRKPHNIDGTLGLLDRWLHERGLRDAGKITPKVLVQWIEHQRVRLHPATVAVRTGIVKRFFLHLYSRGICPTNPAALLPAARSPFYLPYVFTLEEVRRLLTEGVASLPDEFTRLTAYTFFHLLYATGMRHGEALALRVGDLDLPQKVLHIRTTKFHKERVIPIGRRAAANIEAYLSARQKRPGSIRPSDHVFLAPGHGWKKRRRGPMCNGVSFKLFDRMLRTVGLRPAPAARPRTHGAPRIHTLRHTFCVHRFVKWYREGLDLAHKLFLLSVYVGHSQPELTVVYLRATEALLAAADERFMPFLDGLR